MKNIIKTKVQLSDEIKKLNDKIAELTKFKTERKRTEKILISEKDKLQLLLDGLSQTGIGVDIVGLDYKVLNQNKILIDRFGDITGKMCYKEYMGFDEPCSFCPMIKAIKNNTVEKVELKAADGKDYELTSTSLQNPDGSVDKVIEVVNDITERKRAEEKLKSRNKELEIFYDATVNRELQMIELKKEINELLEDKGEKLKYKIVS